MSEVPDQGQVPGQAGGAGALIRRAREDAGMHIAALAVALKVPVRRLEALEAERYDLLPDAVFARALASSVCRHLKIDPARVLPLLPHSQVQAPTVEGRINEPFRSADQGPVGWWTQVSRPALIAAGVLVLAAAAVYLLPPFGALTSEPAAVAPVPAPAPAQTGAVPAPAATAPGMVVESVPVPVGGAPDAGTAAAPSAPPASPAPNAAASPGTPAPPQPATR